MKRGSPARYGCRKSADARRAADGGRRRNPIPQGGRGGHVGLLDRSGHDGSSHSRSRATYPTPRLAEMVGKTTPKSIVPGMRSWSVAEETLGLDGDNEKYRKCHRRKRRRDTSGTP